MCGFDNISPLLIKDMIQYIESDEMSTYHCLSWWNCQKNIPIITLCFTFKFKLFNSILIGNYNPSVITTQRNRFSLWPRSEGFEKCSNSYLRETLKCCKWLCPILKRVELDFFHHFQLSQAAELLLWLNAIHSETPKLILAYSNIIHKSIARVSCVPVIMYKYIQMLLVFVNQLLHYWLQFKNWCHHTYMD